jgi:hypothetical protein
MFFIFVSNAVSNLDFTLKATEANPLVGAIVEAMTLLRKEALVFNIFYRVIFIIKKMIFTFK